MRTLQELAKEALDVQDACNMGGVSNRFAKVVQEVRACYNGPSTGQMNQHPIIQLWASKIHDLAGMGISDTDSFAKAYSACTELAAQCNCGDTACAATPGHCGAYKA